MSANFHFLKIHDEYKFRGDEYCGDEYQTGHWEGYIGSKSLRWSSIA